MSDERWFLLVCRDCDGNNPDRWLIQPFRSAEDRGYWAAQHIRGTGHDRWWVEDESADPDHTEGT